MNNRIIKFRAWDTADVSVYDSPRDKKRMSYYGPDFTMDDNANSLNFVTPEGMQAPFGDHSSMERYILMQFIGHQDANGNDLYEGDICEVGIKISVGWLKKIGVMKWWQEESRFSLQFDMDDSWGVEGEATQPVRIGNIYENPKLLKATG